MVKRPIIADRRGSAVCDRCLNAARVSEVKTIDYYYAPISGYAYLGEPRLVRVARSAGVSICFKPLDIGPVFEAAGVVPPARQSAERQAYRQADMARIAERVGLSFNPKPAFWPVPMSLSARVVLAAQALGLDCHLVSMSLMRAIQVEDKDISNPDHVNQVLTTARLPAIKLLQTAEQAEIYRALDLVNAEAIELGVFGSPTYVFGSQTFFGQDRLCDLAWHLEVDPLSTLGVATPL